MNLCHLPFLAIFLASVPHELIRCAFVLVLYIVYNTPPDGLLGLVISASLPSSVNVHHLVLVYVELFKVARVVIDFEGLQGAAVHPGNVPWNYHVFPCVKVDVNSAPWLLPGLYW